MSPPDLNFLPKTSDNSFFHFYIFELFNVWFDDGNSMLTHFSPVSHFYTPLKMSENLWFSDVFRWYRNVTLE